MGIAVSLWPGLAVVGQMVIAVLQWPGLAVVGQMVIAVSQWPPLFSLVPVNLMLHWQKMIGNSCQRALCLKTNN